MSNVKEKANEIKSEYWGTSTECAIIHVNGIIEELDNVSSNYDIDLSDDIRYWNEVLNQLNQM